ncbi:MbtH family NRPS accessory protein [Streptomyces sp. NPDC058653]|uniref:MbtH family NRPS accessory protein n=1 Tax=Streptomyces sp. NPDC058653 TaxID=3346576 RepID=UPI00364BC83F
MSSDPFDDADGRFHVLVNEEEQHSLRPSPARGDGGALGNVRRPGAAPSGCSEVAPPPEGRVRRCPVRAGLRNNSPGIRLSEGPAPISHMPLTVSNIAAGHPGEAY